MIRSLRIPATVSRQISVSGQFSRALSLTPTFLAPKFDYTPSPPKLPREQQEEFEQLQKLANSQAAIDEYNRQIEENGFHDQHVTTDVGVQTSYFKTIPEFEGDVNPVTGEQGGPKQDPLKHNDWSFNGRVTDF